MDKAASSTGGKGNDVEQGHKKRWSVLSQIDNLVTIAGLNLTYTVNNGKKNKGKQRILSNVSAEFGSGRITAVMGASGAGKTSLLYAMAGELPPSSFSGTLLVNGEEWAGRRMREISGFVFQDDVLLDTMTVREALWMSATLRLQGVRREEREGMVSELLEILGLKDCQNTVIGSPSTVKGISGGERKRCSIAMELITNPAVLFLDEPTSGLDSLTAYNVVTTLRELAHVHGRTVICTIHQPSSDTFHLFDDLLLLGGGQVLYHGPVQEAVAYFTRLGYECPPYTNPADYFLMHVPPASALVQSAWLQSGELAAIKSRLAGMKPVGVAKTVVKKMATWPRQFTYLLFRTMRNAWRNKMILHVKLLQNILVGLLVGLIYYDTDSKSVPVQIQDRNGALYFVVVSQFMGASMGFVSVFSQEKAVFMREYGAGYYSIVPYFFSKILVEVY
jgi:ATP-binding cassette subfamily G (WHITE) protein 1